MKKNCFTVKTAYYYTKTKNGLKNAKNGVRKTIVAI